MILQVITSCPLILANLCVYFKFAGMELVVSQPGVCTDTNFLPVCIKKICLNLCITKYGLRTDGQCKGPIICRCYFYCPAKDENTKPNLPYPPHTKNPET